MTEFFANYTIWTIWIVLGLLFLVFLVMAPCHAVFLLPFMGIPLFWLVPLEYALPVNIVTWVVSPFLYRLLRRAMRGPPVDDGFGSLVGTQTEVISRLAAGRSAKYLVRAQGELWSAYSTDVLEVGETVNIVAVKGIRMVIERAENGSRPVKTGVGDDRGHCH